MSDDDVSLCGFVIECFGCIPRELKQRITVKEWIQVQIVYQRRFMGADRRDMGLARLGVHLCAANGQQKELEDFLPVRLWKELTTEQLIERVAERMETLFE